MEAIAGAGDRNITANLEGRGYSPEEISLVLGNAREKQERIVLNIIKLREEGYPFSAVHEYLKNQGFTDSDIPKITDYAKNRVEGSIPINTAIFITAFLILGVILSLTYKVILKRAIEKPESELEKLNVEKQGVERELELAKIKYHQRNLSEESYREIVNDHQKRLIEIESRMSDVERRVNTLEDKGGTESVIAAYLSKKDNMGGGEALDKIRGIWSKYIQTGEQGKNSRSVDKKE